MGTQQDRPRPRLPRLPTWLLNRLTPQYRREILLGDFEEGYREMAGFRGAARARRWYWGQALRSLPAFLYQSFYWGVVMLRNYLTIALRTMRKHKGYAFINITGLAVGMACCLLILLYVQHESSYDAYHEKADRIHRLVLTYKTAIEEPRVGVLTPPTFAPLLLKDYPEIEQVVRFQPQNYLVTYGDQQFYEDQFFWADAGAFEIFTWPLLMGDPLTVLKDPYSVVLTESSATKYFGKENPLGKVIIVEDSLHFTVTGMMKDLPETAHFNVEMVGSFSTLEQRYPKLNEEWFAFSYFTYVLVSEQADPVAVGAQIESLSAHYIGDWEEEYRFSMRLSLQPLTDIHLHSNYEREIEPNGNLAYVYIFSAIAFIILLIACINFMNLATARSTQRAKEVGMRKVLGAHRGLLFRQFLGESVLFSVLALVLAMGLVALFLPAFNALADKQLAVRYLDNSGYLLGLLGIALFVGVVAGSYPALILSAFRPIHVLKGLLAGKGTKHGGFRKGLVVFQFTVSMVLIVGTITVFKQMEYMQQKALGFTKEQIVVMPIRGNDQVQQHHESIKEELLQHPEVLGVAFSSKTPGKKLDASWVHEEGALKEEGRDMNILSVDYDFITMYGLEVVAGRDFSRDFATDATEGYILNEAAVDELAWGSPEQAVGKQFRCCGNDSFGKIIGVVKDFHHLSPHQTIEPAALMVRASSFNYLSVRISTENVGGVLGALESSWHNLVPGRPFDYFFLDEDYDHQYRTEQQLGTIMSIFSLLALLVACLGLFGLASYMAEQRTKEIGIRKVLGASVRNIVVLLSQAFFKLIVLAFVGAVPIAYFAMSLWLQDFAYRIEISWRIFLIAGLASLGIALLTVSYQAIKAALNNPVESLRYE